MNTFHSIYNFSSKKKTIVTIGTFDGVHIGHKSILEKLKKRTNNGEYESVVLTFFPHPRMVLNQESNIKLINTIEEKTNLLESFGIDFLIIHPFDSTFSNLSAEEFVKNILVDQLNVHEIIIGYDHRFGKNRSADINDLINFGKEYDFLVDQIGAKEIDEIAVSSTKIRKALQVGDIKLANQYLGYSYFFSGKVIEGKQIGRTIGFPTANIQLQESYKMLPKNGVYVISSKIDDVLYYGMMNIGKNPTIGENEQSIEVHFFEFNQDLYKKTIEISILTNIREEIKFNTINDLRNQLEHDKKYSINYINNIKQ